MPKLAILTLDGCHAGTVYGLRDLVAAANRVSEIAGRGAEARIDVRLLGLSRSAAVAADGGAIEVDGTLARARRVDAVAVPGCMTDPERLEECIGTHHRAAAALDRAHAAGAIVAGHCSSIFLLGQAGLLDGRRATVTWWAQPLFRKTHPHARLDEEEALTEDGRVLCSAGPFSHHRLGLRLIERLVDAEIARLTAQFCMLDLAFPGQSAFRSAEIQQHEYPLAYAIELVVRRRLPEVPSVRELARELGLSHRTLQRKLDQLGLASPRTLIERVRIDRARELLGATETPLAEIASQVGYADASRFGRAFARVVGTTPADHRRRLRRTQSAMSAPARPRGR